MNTMINLLLLFLSLMAGCEASEVKGCKDGWVEFTCKYPNRNETYTSINVDNPGRKSIRSTMMDVWENKNGVSLYRDTKNKNLKVTIRQITNQDSGKYGCKFYKGSKSSSDSMELVVDNGCQEQFIQTAYRTAKTTITCDGGDKDDSRVKFLCKENGSICEDILSTKYSPKSTVTLNKTKTGVNMSISDVSSQHAGVYWCGEESTKGSDRASLRKIQLTVVKDVLSFKRSPTIGHNLTYWCGYQNRNPKKIFICKGDDPSICKLLGSKAQSEKNKRVFLKDKGEEQRLFITVINVTTSDAGTYWCGEKSSDKGHSNQFIHRMEMTVVSPTSAPESHGEGLPVVIAVVVSVFVLLLLFVLISILIYKRHLKNKRNSAAAAAAAAAAQHHTEEYIYEEIQELPQTPVSGNAVSTVYVTANFATNPSASPLYSTVGFQNSSGEADEALIIKPSFSVCEYSTVKDSQSPTYSTANQPSSEEPLYSSVYNPKDEK